MKAHLLQQQQHRSRCAVNVSARLRPSQPNRYREAGRPERNANRDEKLNQVGSVWDLESALVARVLRVQPLPELGCRFFWGVLTSCCSLKGSKRGCVSEMWSSEAPENNQEKQSELNLTANLEQKRLS